MKKYKSKNGFSEAMKIEPLEISPSSRIKPGLISKPLEDALNAVERMGDFTKH